MHCGVSHTARHKRPGMPTVTTVVIVDDHRAFGERLRSFVRDQLHCTVVGTGADARTGLDLIQALRPDVALIDVGLPGESGFDLSRRLAAELPNVRVVLMGDEESVEYMRAADAAGAVAYLSKTAVSQSLAALLGANAAEVMSASINQPRLGARFRSRLVFSGLLAALVLVSGLALGQPAAAVAGAIGVLLLSSWRSVRVAGRYGIEGTRWRWPPGRGRRGAVAPVAWMEPGRPGKEGEDLG